MKRFATTYPNGHCESSSSCHEANNFQNFGANQQFFLFGKAVAPEAFFLAVAEAVEAAWAKKNETHRRAKVLFGASVASRTEVWIKR